MPPLRRLPAIATILVGTVLGQGLVVAISPLLTRTYGPADFGALAVVTAIASILGAGATLGTDRALAVAPDGQAPRALVLIGLVVAVAVGAGTAVVTWATRDVLAARFAAPALSELWWVLPVTVTAIGVQRVGSAVLARRRQHGSIAVRNACQGIGQSAWNLAMAFAGPVGLLGGLAAGRLAAVIGMLRLGRTTQCPSRTAIRVAAGQHRRFLLITPWSSMLNVVGQQAPGLVIAAVHGSVAAGFVALTMRVLGSPVGMVADATAQYAAGAFGQRIRSDDTVGPLLLRIVLRLSLAGAAAAVLVLVSGPAAFAAVFGDRWSVSGTYAQILVPAFAVQVAVSPMTQLLSMLGGQSLQLVWDVGRLVLSATAVVVPSVVGAPMAVVLSALAWSMVVSYSVVLVCVLRAVCKYDEDVLGRGKHDM